MILGNGNFFCLLTVFWTFHDNYSAKSGIIGLIDRTGFWEFTRLENYRANSQISVQSRNPMLGIFSSLPAFGRKNLPASDSQVIEF